MAIVRTSVFVIFHPKEDPEKHVNAKHQGSSVVWQVREIMFVIFFHFNSNYSKCIFSHSYVWLLDF